MFNGSSLSVGEDEKVLEMVSGGVCTSVDILNAIGLSA